jgi:anti-anti-sigma factor
MTDVILMVQELASKNTSRMPVESEFHWLKTAMYVAENTTDEEIVVDISSVDKIQSSEINQLIRLHLDVKQQGRRLVLERAQHQIWEIFTLTRLNRLIEIRDPLIRE